MELDQSLELIGKRWGIFVLLSKKKYYVSELAKELHKSKPQISSELRELQKNGLVEYEQKEGERLKYCYVSDYARKIITAVTEVAQSKPKERLEEWQINEFLSVLEDQDLSHTLRESYSDSLYSVCRGHPIEVISFEATRKLFEKVVEDPSHDKITEELRKSVSAILPHALCHEKWRNWVLRRLHPVFVKNMENRNENTRVWAIKKVGQIAGIEPFVKAKAEKKFLEIWFSNETDPDSELGKEVKLQLVGLASKRLFENVRARAKKQENKVKAEILLERLKECLKPT